MRINIFAPIFVAAVLYASLAFGAEKSCETVGPRLDNTYVTICDGSVVKVTLGKDR